MTLIKERCQVCGDRFELGCKYWVDIDALCWDCKTWAENLIYKLSRDRGTAQNEKVRDNPPDPNP